MNLLLELTLRGTLATVLVVLLDHVFAGRVSARARRVWWGLVPIAFLLMIPVWVTSYSAEASSSRTSVDFDVVGRMTGTITRNVAARLGGAQAPGPASVSAPLCVVTAGALVYLLVAAVRAVRALRRWGRERLSTDASLLGALEDCKARAGVTTPIGLVVSDAVAAPAILGWLRPRILLPRVLISSLSREQLRGVLFHELAHFRNGDVQFNWLFTLVCALHWFNPAAHLAFRAWLRFCEESADETAIAWLNQPSGDAYGETLLHVLRKIHGPPAPFAALAIVESVSQLKKRLTMIKHYEKKSPRYLFTGFILLLAATFILLRPVRAADTSDDPKAIAAGVMQDWLKELDNGKYAQSWTDAAPAFQKAVTSDGWTATCKQVRTPLGKCNARNVASASRQTDLPSPQGASKGDFILAQFDTSFEGLKYAVETVTFMKAPDGTWKAAGYYIKPKL